MCLQHKFVPAHGVVRGADLCSHVRRAAESELKLESGSKESKVFVSPRARAGVEIILTDFNSG